MRDVTRVGLRNRIDSVLMNFISSAKLQISRRYESYLYRAYSATHIQEKEQLFADVDSYLCARELNRGEAIGVSEKLPGGHYLRR